MIQSCLILRHLSHTGFLISFTRSIAFPLPHLLTLLVPLCYPSLIHLPHMAYKEAYSASLSTAPVSHAPSQNVCQVAKKLCYYQFVPLLLPSYIDERRLSALQAYHGYVLVSKDALQERIIPICPILCM